MDKGNAQQHGSAASQLPVLPGVLDDGDSEKLCEIKVVLVGRLVGKRMYDTCFLPRSGFPSQY